MRAMVVRRYGPPKVLESQQVPDLPPKAGEVLIRVKAIGVNFADLLQRMGLYPGTPKPPFVPGLEIAGVVEKIVEGGRRGEGEGLKPGDAVVALPHFNAYAEWAAVPVSVVYRLPPGMPFEDGAAIPVNYLTAHHAMFTMGNLQPGDRILIHGAAGGVGIAAVQLARAKGLVVFGTAGPEPASRSGHSCRHGSRAPTGTDGLAGAPRRRPAIPAPRIRWQQASSAHERAGAWPAAPPRPSASTFRPARIPDLDRLGLPRSSGPAAAAASPALCPAGRTLATPATIPCPPGAVDGLTESELPTFHPTALQPAGIGPTHRLPHEIDRK